MTNAEAIKIINQYDCNFYWTDGEKIPTEDLIEAFELAVKALKEQEPVKPYLDYDGSDAWRVWRCVACGASLFHHVEDKSEEGMKNYVRYCKHCGRALKWG